MKRISPRLSHGRESSGRGWAAGLVLSLASVLGCRPAVTGIKGTEDIAGVDTIAEAQAIVDDAQKAYARPNAKVAPRSLAECVEVLRRDESERFAVTRDYLSTLDGIEALALRARLEALWTEGQLVVADLARERARRLDRDVRTMEQTLKLHPDDERVHGRIDEARRQAEHERRLAEALSKLAEPHFEAALGVTREVIRRDRARADGYGTLANLYRLRGDWGEFDRNLTKAESLGEDGMSVRYARAMALVERKGDREGAKRALAELLAEHPDVARIQARLVLLEENLQQRYEQLQKLERINPHHALIALEGAAIRREYQAATSGDAD